MKHQIARFSAAFRALNKNGDFRASDAPLALRNRLLSGKFRLALQDLHPDQMPALNFHRLQFRHCSGTQIPPEQSKGDPGKLAEELSRPVALEKLTSLVEKWILETDFDMEAEESPKRKARLASASGMVDDWNFEDWRSPDEVDAHDKLDMQKVLQEPSEEQGMHEVDKGTQEKGTVYQRKPKRVYGMDKCLPPRVVPEFTEATSLADLTANDVNKLYNFSKEDEARFFPEGLPVSLSKEFDISRVNALLIRSQVLKLAGHLKCLSQKKSTEPTSSGNSHEELSDDEANTKEVIVIEPPGYISLNAKKKLARERRLLDKADLGSKRQIVLDGLPGSGKSVALAMLVQWARSEGWLVFYVPSAKQWTHGGLYYKNKLTGLWDTPLAAISVLENILKSHSDILEVIPCRVVDPIPLGEGPGIGLLSGPQEVPVGEGFTLKDLIQLGLRITHAAVGVVVRLRKELSLVEEVPVLIAVDQFNSWFTFSEYHQSIGEFGRQQIHARELAMVDAFRNMTYGPFMVGAFSHSTNVGKLPKQLPGIPLEAKVFLNRYDFLEASIMLKHYMRQLSPKAKYGKRARRTVYMLTNGNANELRDTAFLQAAGTRPQVPVEAMA